MDQARTALRALRDDGVDTVVTTPHLDASLTRRPGELERVLGILDRGWDALRAMAAVEFPDVALGRGVELRLDIPDPDLSDPRLRLAGSRAALVEFDGFTVPLRAEDVLAGLVDDGWTPVLAHPERYRGVPPDRLRSLHATGTPFQPCLSSMVCLSRPTASNGQPQLRRSTLPSTSHREPMVAEARAAVTDRMGTDAATLLFDTNGRRILDGETPLPVAPGKAGEGVLGRIAGWLGR